MGETGRPAQRPAAGCRCPRHRRVLGPCLPQPQRGVERPQGAPGAGLQPATLCQAEKIRPVTGHPARSVADRPARVDQAALRRVHRQRGCQPACGRACARHPGPLLTRWRPQAVVAVGHASGGGGGRGVGDAVQARGMERSAARMAPGCTCSRSGISSACRARASAAPTLPERADAESSRVAGALGRQGDQPDGHQRVQLPLPVERARPGHGRAGCPAEQPAERGRACRRHRRRSSGAGGGGCGIHVNATAARRQPTTMPICQPL